MVNAEIRIVVRVTGGAAAAEIGAKTAVNEKHAALNPFSGMRYFLALEGPTTVDSTSTADSWMRAKSLVGLNVPGRWTIADTAEPGLDGHAWIEDRWVKTATIPGAFAHSFELMEFDLQQQQYIAASRTLAVDKNGQKQNLEVRCFLCVQKTT